MQPLKRLTALICSTLIVGCSHLSSHTISTPMPDTLTLSAIAPSQSIAWTQVQGRWEGVWGGEQAIAQGQAVDSTLVLDQIRGDQALLLYSWGAQPKLNIEAGYQWIYADLHIGATEITLDWSENGNHFSFSYQSAQQFQGTVQLADGREGTIQLHKAAQQPPRRLADNDPRQLALPWQQALVATPQQTGLVSRMHTLMENNSLYTQRYPTVIYLHGCGGFWDGTYRVLSFFQQQGFAVIAPDSFARADYPTSCDSATQRFGLNRQTVQWRQLDAQYAIEQAKKLPWVDADNLFVVGFSEGATVAATVDLSAPSHHVNARVIAGWTCHSGWPEYQGLHAPASQPVLSLIASDDPWYQQPSVQGHCGPFLTPNNGSESIVYRQELRYDHALLDYDKPRQAIIEFLQQHRVR